MVCVVSLSKCLNCWSAVEGSGCLPLLDVSSCSYFAVFASQSPSIQPSQVQQDINVPRVPCVRICLITSKGVSSRSFLLCGGLRQWTRNQTR